MGCERSTVSGMIINWSQRTIEYMVYPCTTYLHQEWTWDTKRRFKGQSFVLKSQFKLNKKYQNRQFISIAPGEFSTVDLQNLQRGKYAYSLRVVQGDKVQYHVDNSTIFSSELIRIFIERGLARRYFSEDEYRQIKKGRSIQDIFYPEISTELTKKSTYASSQSD